MVAHPIAAPPVSHTDMSISIYMNIYMYMCTYEEACDLWDIYI
jgi:hypothetical protein